MKFTTTKRILFFFALSLTNGLNAEDDWPQFGGPNANFTGQQRVNWHNEPPTKRWQRQLGPGMSGLVAKDAAAYTIFLKPFSEEETKLEESKRTHREVVLAVDAENGETLWQHEYESGWIESQQAFGGRVRAPQATPLICGRHLVTIGFTGIVHCFDRTSGNVIWKQNLIERYEAVPVQFGFSASPVCDQGKLYILSGGQSGGLVCLNVDDGKLVWRRPCNEASYATPVTWNRPDGKQIVFVTRNRVVGVSADNGDQLWEYKLAGKGLTNVPTPMVLDDEDLVISGQGVKGTRRLNVASKRNEYAVSEVWESNAQFFYCNWLRMNDLLLGCNGDLLLAMDLNTGSTVGRYRGYSEANLLMTGRTLLVFDGEGHLSRLRVTPSQLTVIAKYSVLNERCWTTPTLIGDKLFCRGGDQLLCLDLGGGDPRAAVVPVRVRKTQLAIKGKNSSAEVKNEVEAMPEIIAAFENGGSQAAWKAYTRIREDDPEALNYEQRQSLAEMAQEAGLNDFALLITKHAKEDFPKIAKEISAALNPSNKVQVGDNGLTYLEFSIRNTSATTIQAEVRGPKGHPFGYGLPLRPGRPRAEKWPVGTKLYRTKLGVRSGLLLTVEENFAGRVIDLPMAKHNESTSK